MTVFQSAQGAGKVTPPAGYSAGLTITNVVEYTFDRAYVAATDRIEMAVLPATARLLSCVAVFANVGAVNTSLGIMSGAIGSTDNARTVGTQLFAAQTMANAEVAVTRTNCLAVARDSNADRSIGMIPATDIAAGGTKKVTLIIEYTF